MTILVRQNIFGISPAFSRKNMLASSVFILRKLSAAYDLADKVRKKHFYPDTEFCRKRGKNERNQGKTDTVEKEFVAFPDVAADVINALLYLGEAVTNEKTLLAAPTESVYQGEARLRSQYEDVC